MLCADALRGDKDPAAINPRLRYGCTIGGQCIVTLATPVHPAARAGAAFVEAEDGVSGAQQDLSQVSG